MALVIVPSDFRPFVARASHRHPELQCFRNVICLNRLRSAEIGDGPGNLSNPIVGARAERQSLDSGAQKPSTSAVERTMTREE